MFPFGPSREVRDTAASIEILADGLDRLYSTMPSDRFLAHIEKNHRERHDRSGSVVWLDFEGVTMIRAKLEIELTHGTRTIELLGLGH